MLFFILSRGLIVRGLDFSHHVEVDDVIYGWPPNGDPLDVAFFRYPFLLAPPIVRSTLEEAKVGR